jgi:hypothetical protein
VLVIGPEEQAELAQNRRRHLESIREKDQCEEIVHTQVADIARAEEGHGQALG